MAHIPGNPDWAEALSIATLSAFVEGVQFATIKGGINGNLFFLCIAPSGIGNKSLPLRNITSDILHKASEELEKRQVMKGLMLPDKFTVESLINHFSTESNVGIIVSDEFTSTLKDATKDYLTTLMEFLSELYDGRAQSRTTMKNGWMKSEKCYVSFVSATTSYIYKLLKPQLFIQGTGNRFLYVLHENPEFTDYKPGEFFVPPQRLDELDTKNQDFANRLADFREVLVKNKWVIMPTPEAENVLLDFRRQVEPRAIAEFKKGTSMEFNPSYLSRMQENCYKLCLIKAVSDNFDNISNLDGLIVLNEDHAKWAVTQIMKYYQYFEKMIIQWQDDQHQNTKNTKTSGPLKRLLLSIIKRYGIISQQQLLIEAEMFKGTQFYSLVQTLIDEGRIRKLTDQEVNAIPFHERAKYGIGPYKGQVPAVYKFVKD